MLEPRYRTRLLDDPKYSEAWKNETKAALDKVGGAVKV